jgi:hypothetical protein
MVFVQFIATDFEAIRRIPKTWLSDHAIHCVLRFAFGRVNANQLLVLVTINLLHVPQKKYSIHTSSG